MKLLVSSLKKEISNLDKNNVRFTVMGDILKLDSKVQEEIHEAMNLTKQNSGLNLNLALSYGGRQELVHACNEIIKKYGLDAEFTEELISQHLYTSKLPDPDLLIRTGGEMRVSNFLLWQIAYTELHITETFWPELRKITFRKSYR